MYVTFVFHDEVSLYFESLFYQGVFSLYFPGLHVKPMSASESPGIDKGQRGSEPFGICWDHISPHLLAPRKAAVCMAGPPESGSFWGPLYFWAQKSLRRTEQMLLPAFPPKVGEWTTVLLFLSLPNPHGVSVTQNCIYAWLS